MNNAYKIQGLEQHIYLQLRLIYAIDKLASSLGYKNIIIGYDNRHKSSKIANFLAEGLSTILDVNLTDRPVPSSLVSLLVSREWYDMSVYITGDYNDWKSYGVKIKIDKGRNLSVKEMSNLTKLLKEFSPSIYRVEFSYDFSINNYDTFYLQELKKEIQNKKLPFNMAINHLDYANIGLSAKLFRHFNLKLNPFLTGNMHLTSPNPFNKSNLQESYFFLYKYEDDFIVSLTDGELLVIQTKQRIFYPEDLALMLAEIQKDNIKKVILAEEHKILLEFANQNGIKYVIDNKRQIICNTPNTLALSIDGCIVDSNFGKSMDSNYVLLKILDYLATNNLSIEEFYDKLLLKYYKKENN